MRVIPNFPFSKEPPDLQSVWGWIRKFVNMFSGAVNGALGFGDGIAPDNIGGVWVLVPDTGAANADFAVLHNLAVVPVGFLLMVPPAAGFVYKGATAWDTVNIFLRCSAANQSVKVFVLSDSTVTR